jgi:hypothetical protein
MSIQSQIYTRRSYRLFFSFARRKRMESFFTQMVEFETYLSENNWARIKKKERFPNSILLTTQLSKFTDTSLVKVIDFFSFAFNRRPGIFFLNRNLCRVFFSFDLGFFLLWIFFLRSVLEHQDNRMIFLLKSEQADCKSYIRMAFTDINIFMSFWGVFCEDMSLRGKISVDLILNDSFFCSSLIQEFICFGIQKNHD